MDGERLHAELRGVADDGRGARRPVRAATPVRRRPGAVRGCVGRLCACAKRRLADRRPRHPGVRRGAGDAAGRDATERGVSARAAGESTWGLQWCDRAGRSLRPGGGRRHYPGPRLAVDLLAQRPDWPARHAARTQAHAGELRTTHVSQHGRPRAGDGGSPGGGVGAGAREQVGWGSLEVIATLVGGSGLAVAFVAWERRARVPMLPLRFFRSRAFSAGNAAGFLFFASLYGSAFFLAQFLQTALGYGPLGAGLRLLPLTAILFVTAPIAGVLVNRFGERTLMVGGLLLQAIAMAWIGLIARPGLAYPELVAPLFIAGFGAAAIPAGQNAVVSSVAAAEIGKASGTFNMLRQLGAAFGVALLAAVFAGVGSFHSAQAFTNGFAPAMGVCAALSLVGAITGMALPGRRDMALMRTKVEVPETREREPLRSA